MCAVESGYTEARQAGLTLNSTHSRMYLDREELMGMNNQYRFGRTPTGSAAIWMTDLDAVVSVDGVSKDFEDAMDETLPSFDFKTDLKTFVKDGLFLKVDESAFYMFKAIAFPRSFDRGADDTFRNAFITALHAIPKNRWEPSFSPVANDLITDREVDLVLRLGAQMPDRCFFKSATANTIALVLEAYRAGMSQETILTLVGYTRSLDSQRGLLRRAMFAFRTFQDGFPLLHALEKQPSEMSVCLSYPAGPENPGEDTYTNNRHKMFILALAIENRGVEVSNVIWADGPEGIDLLVRQIDDHMKIPEVERLSLEELKEAYRTNVDGAVLAYCRARFPEFFDNMPTEMAIQFYLG